MNRFILTFLAAGAITTASAQMLSAQAPTQTTSASETSSPAQNPAIDPNWVVPAKAVVQKNPLAGKPEAGAGGRKIFSRSCAMCHGDERTPRKNNAPDLGSQAAQSETDGSLFWRISNGNSRRGMPSFSSLPEGQRWQLVMYIRTLGMKNQ